MAIFTNAFRAVTTSSEVQILFRLATPNINEENNTIGEPFIEDIADIRISPEIAKSLCETILSQINQQEESKA